MKTKLTKIERYSIVFSIAGAIVLVCLIASLCSCSSRTVTKSENKSDSTATNKTEISVKESETIKESTKTDSTSSKKKETIVNIFEDALELEPIDATKESSFTDNNGNKKTFKNVRIKRNQSQNNSTINESENIRKLEEKNTEIATLKDSIYNLNNSIELSKNDSTKATKRTSFNWWWLLLLLIPLALWIWWKYYKSFDPLSYLKFPKLS